MVRHGSLILCQCTTIDGFPSRVQMALAELRDMCFTLRVHCAQLAEEMEQSEAVVTRLHQRDVEHTAWCARVKQAYTVWQASQRAEAERIAEETKAIAVQRAEETERVRRFEARAEEARMQVGVSLEERQRVLREACVDTLLGRESISSVESI